MSPLTTLLLVIASTSTYLPNTLSLLEHLVQIGIKVYPEDFTNWSQKLNQTIQGINTGGKALWLYYKVKEAKIVNILSTMHHFVLDHFHDGSRKPRVIFYIISLKEVETRWRRCVRCTS